MEEQPGVTIDFTIKGADPNAKMDPDAPCAVCEKKFSEHTQEMHKACASEQRRRIFGK
jgi:hypothetical protein